MKIKLLLILLLLPLTCSGDWFEDAHYLMVEPYNTVSNPVGHWKLNDNLATTNVLDAAGNDNLTSQHGNTSTLSTTTAKQGLAFSFDGTNDYLKKTIANYRSTDSLGSISAWVKISTVENQMILSSTDEGTDTSYFFFSLKGSGDNGIRFTVQNAGGTANNITGTTDVLDDEWHHCVVTSDGSQWRMYVDSAIEDITILSGANTGDWFADVTLRDNVTIGALERKIGTTEYQTGILDDVRVYSRTLTQKEINTLYNGGRGTER